MNSPRWAASFGRIPGATAREQTYSHTTIRLRDAAAAGRLTLAILSPCLAPARTGASTRQTTTVGSPRTIQLSVSMELGVTTLTQAATGYRGGRVLLVRKKTKHF